MSVSEEAPVVLIHGWAGSFAETWQSTGMDALLQDGGRQVIGVDLLGHGAEDKPHDPAAYSNLHEWLLDKLAGAPPVVDAVGFSLGAMTLLRALIARPDRFGRVILSGIGDRVFEERDESDGRRIVQALEGTGDPAETSAQVFVGYANAPGKDKAALTAIMKRPPEDPVDPAVLGGIRNEVLVVIGDNDFAGPAGRLADSFPNGRLIVLRNTDHFATPESFKFIDAVLGFLGAA